MAEVETKDPNPFLKPGVEFFNNFDHDNFNDQKLKQDIN